MPLNRDALPDAASYFEACGLKLAGARSAKWKTTSCTFHGGSDSMRINTHSGAWVCMACEAKGGDVLAYEIATTGAEFVDAAKALGAWVEDANGRHSPPPKPTPLSPRQAISALAFEATLTAIAAGNVARGVALTQTDKDRLIKAANRINRIKELFA